MIKKYSKLSPHTFGGSRASENLTEMLNTQYPHIISKVSRHYHSFTRHMVDCLHASKHFSDGGFGVMVELYKQHKFDIVRQSNMPDFVKSHLLNIMSTSYKIRFAEIKKLMSNNRRVKNDHGC